MRKNRNLTQIVQNFTVVSFQVKLNPLVVFTVDRKFPGNLRRFNPIFSTYLSKVMYTRLWKTKTSSFGVIFFFYHKTPGIEIADLLCLRLSSSLKKGVIMRLKKVLFLNLRSLKTPKTFITSVSLNASISVFSKLVSNLWKWKI